MFKVIFKEVVATIFMLFTAFLSIRPRSWHQEKGSFKTPVLLVHGYLSFSSIFLLLGRRLSKGGVNHVYTLNLGSPLISIAVYADLVKKRVEEICKERGVDRIVLIGYSMGGIVSAYYAVEVDSKAAWVITLGSPLGGTCMANLGFGKCAREMRLESPFLATLKKKMQHSKVRFDHFGVQRDFIVVPAVSAFTGKEHYLEGCGHVSIPYAKSTSDELLRLLHSYDTV